MATAELTFNVRVRWRRFEHMKAHAIAQVRRAPRRDRGALVDRYARAMASACIIATVASHHNDASRVLPGRSDATGTGDAVFDTFSVA